MIDGTPGEVRLADDPVTINADRATTALTVENTGDRPVQVGSHFHFFEVNPALAFDREAAYGYRLNVPAGTAVRFEPGQRRTVDLVAIGGDRVVRGMGGLVDGDLDDEAVRERAMERAEERGYLAAATDAFEDGEDSIDGSEREDSAGAADDGANSAAGPDDGGDGS